MRVLQISTFPNKAAGSIMMNIHNEMNNEGIQSYVVWGRGRSAENSHEYNMGDNFGIKLHGVYTRITDKTGFASSRATKKLLSWIDNIKPDIIHIHCIHGYYINIRFLFEYICKNNIKVVWTQHDCWAFTGHCAYFDAVSCEKWKNGCNNCKQLNTFPASKILDNSKWNWNQKRNLFNSVDISIVTPCEWLKTLIEKSFLRRHSVQVIYNGIDLNIFRRIKSDFKKNNKIGSKKIILGVASEWTERKGLNDFIKLDKLINHQMYQIVVVGVNDKQKKALPSSIIAINRTNDVHELVDIYCAATVFFNPTYEDNFPTTNLEAIACGTPVITYRTGGSPEAVGTCGYTIDKGDVDAVFRLLPLVENIGEIEISDIFTKENMISKYIELYKKIYGDMNGEN